MKTVVVFALLFAALAAMTGMFAHTQTERIVSWIVFLLLVVVIYSPPFTRWYRKKG